VKNRFQILLAFKCNFLVSNFGFKCNFCTATTWRPAKIQSSRDVRHSGSSVGGASLAGGGLHLGGGGERRMLKRRVRYITMELRCGDEVGLAVHVLIQLTYSLTAPGFVSSTISTRVSILRAIALVCSSLLRWQTGPKRRQDTTLESCYKVKKRFPKFVFQNSTCTATPRFSSRRRRRSCPGSTRSRPPPRSRTPAGLYKLTHSLKAPGFNPRA
jgi:hypothetical protein